MRRIGLLVCSLLYACSSTSSEASFAGDSFGEKSAGAPNSSGASDVGTDDTAASAPEKEVESAFETPVATAKAVWIANPKSGRVAFIDAATLEVRTVEAGNSPTYLAAVPGADDAAVVINALSDDVTLLRSTGKTIDSKTFKTSHGLNAWALSSDGRWAIAWTDARRVTSATKTQGFQDLTVIDLSGAVAPQVLAVGYRPIAVGFASGNTTAYAVTQDGVSIVSLTGTPSLTKNVAISDDPLEDPGTRDVSVTPDGSLALIRRDESAEVTFVSLSTGIRSKITLSGPVTDLDLSKDGASAVAVVKKTSTVSVLSIPQALTDSAFIRNTVLTGETVGSIAIADSGLKALAYTNASSVERLSVVSLGTPLTFRTIRLYSPVLAVFPTKSAEHAVVFHDPAETASNAFSLVPIENTFPAKIVDTKAPLTGVALSAASDRAMVIERSDSSKVYGAYLAHLPSLMVERYPLASPPSAVGIVDAARRAFISQEYADGRITFIDLDTGLARTLTGFELSARVVDGSQP